MIILIEARWFRSQADPSRYDYSEGIELHSGWPKPNGYWFIDRHSLRPRGWKQHYAVPAGNIHSFAAIKHPTSCTLLVRSQSILHTYSSATSRRPDRERLPQYMEVGTMFDRTQAEKMIEGLCKLDHRVDEFTWAELLELIQGSAGHAPQQ